MNPGFGFVRWWLSVVACLTATTIAQRFKIDYPEACGSALGYAIMRKFNATSLAQNMPYQIEPEREMPPQVLDVVAERAKQVAKGYTAEHDDHYFKDRTDGLELRMAAAGAIIGLDPFEDPKFPTFVPRWAKLLVHRWRKVGDHRALLVKGVALALAALEAYDRNRRG